ncbi:MAG: 30S ribosomal protein S12 methylthiotransferase RimO [Gammaproteobacteria bacterium]
MASTQPAPSIGFVSLGCPKALVDSEHILSRIRAEGYAIAADYAGADLVVVNTCGFIESAVEESLEAIGEAIAENGRVIVTGCLGSDAERIRRNHPQVLAITGAHAYEAVMAAVHEHLPPPESPHDTLLPPGGLKLTPRHYAYLKISEGCNHRCRFCIIPHLRGDLVSRPIGDVLQEAEGLVARGVRELLVIAQDTSAYGVDLRYRTGFWNGRPIKTRLYELANALGELGVWIRLHYIYPYPHVDDLLPLMAEGKILPYLDVPLQHASERILRSMRRPANDVDMLERIRRWREVCPDLTLRSTFIVGYPGETDEDFQTLLRFLEEAQLDRVGCFTYSPVEGAPANELPNPVPEPLKEERQRILMERQAGISKARLAAKVGKRLTVLVDEIDGQQAVGRSAADAPEVDGLVYIEQRDGLSVGEWYEVEVTGSDEYDLWGRVLSS